MCGILGSISSKNYDIRQSLKSLSHRGPDNSSFYIDETLTLGHTRLSINDLSSEANQPFEDDNTVVVFNGEIYNYLELRNNLDYDFKTNCEAEVICKLYKKYGKEFVNHLDGMFAIVLYDKFQKIIHCYRDRLGKKPFFYYLDENKKEFYFASEQKVFTSFGIELQFDTRVLDNILNFTFYKRESIFSNIFTLEPSEMISIEIDTFNIKKDKYFELSDLIEESYYAELLNSNCENNLEELLQESVKKRLISDVPVGIIGSGGVDSSLIAHYSNRFDKYNLLHVNSVDNSEFKYANILAKDLGVNIIQKELDYEVFKKDINNTLFYWEYPLVHTNAVGILNVSKLAQENGYKVLLGGEGADELFGGYPYHQLYYKSLLLDKYSSFLPTKFLQALIYSRSNTKTANLEPTVEHIYNNNRFTKYENKYSFVKNKVQRKMLTYLATELEEYLIPLLSRADRMSMSHGVEMRLPFLDMNIIKFALNLPLNKKMNLKKTKIILRNIGENLLSDELMHRPKIGFTVDYAKKYIEEESIKNLTNLDKYIDSEAVVNHLKKSNQYHKIIRLYSLDKILGGIV